MKALAIVGTTIVGAVVGCNIGVWQGSKDDTHIPVGAILGGFSGALVGGFAGVVVGAVVFT